MTEPTTNEPPQEPPTPRADKAQAKMTTELEGITEALVNLTDHIDQTLPEERMKQLASAIASEERSGRRRLTATVVGALAIIIFLAASSLAQSHSNGKTLDEAKTVANYVKNCLIASPPHDVSKCGEDTTGEFIKGLIGSLNCSLLIPPAERTEEKLNACAVKAFGG